MTNAELIAEYLENGGNVTKCKNFNPSSDQYRIRSKPSFSKNDSEYRHNQSTDYHKSKPVEIFEPTKTETIRVSGIDVTVKV